MRTTLKRLYFGIVLAAVASGAVLFLRHTPAFQDTDHFTYDFTIDHGGLLRSSPQIFFVDFDEPTFDHIRQYPIPRSTIADVIQRVATGQPRVIGLDVFLSEPRSPAEDQKMQQVLTNAGNVVLASQAATASLPAVHPLPLFCQPEDPRADSGYCKDGTPGALGYALVDMPIEPDGFVRDFNLFSAGDPPSVSFPVFLAQQYTGKTIEPKNSTAARFLGHDVPYHSRELSTALIGAWAPHPATHISVWDLLNGKISPSLFHDKLVLIGQSNDAARDTFFTPLFRIAGKDGLRERMGGTDILAAAIRSLIDGRTARLAPEWMQIAFILLAAGAATYFLLGFELGHGVARLLGLMLLIFAVPTVIYARTHFWLPYLAPELAMLLTVPLALGLQFAQEKLASREARAQREQLMGLFSSYVDPAVAETIWNRRNELSLGGEEHVATVMFTDIRGFTALSAGQTPAQVLGWLNRYLTAMDQVIRAHGGFLNKFIGDGLMIIFGLPLSAGSPQQDARRALDCALAMIQRVEMLNQENKDDPTQPQLRIGVGMHSGRLMAGSIGSASRQEYSVIGATVNLASRLESLNKPFKTEILFSEETRELLVDADYPIEPLGPAKVAGLEEPVPVFTVRPASAARVESVAS